MYQYKGCELQYNMPQRFHAVAGVNYKPRLLHRGPELGRGYREHLPVPQHIPLHRFRGGAGGVEVGHGVGQKYDDDICESCHPPLALEDCTNNGLVSGGKNDATMGGISVGDAGTGYGTPHSLRTHTDNLCNG